MAAPRPLFLRLLGGIGAIILILLALVVSLGAALGAPLGMYFVARRARQRGREPNRIASWFSAVAASSLFAALLWGAIFAFMPRPTEQQLNTAVSEQQSKPKKLPAWYTKMFPQAARVDARTDSASERLMRSPQFVKTVMVMGAVVMGVFLGVIGGSLAWCAWQLFGIARAGPAPPPVPVEYS